MSKYINAIVTEARESTENEEYDDTIGLTEEEIVKFVNQAQYRLHSKILSKHPQAFADESEEDIVKDQESYDLTYKAHLSNKVMSVDYTDTGASTDYYKLSRTIPLNRDTGSDGDPNKYFVRNKKIYLLPTPITAGGKLRVTFVRRLKALDKRRAQVKAVTLDALTSTVTSLEVNYSNGPVVDSAELRKRTRFCVVDKYGNIKMANVLLSELSSSASYDTSLSVDSTFTYQSGETIAVDDYIVSGDFATTHLELGPEIERYIQLYTEYKILKRDSSVDSQEALTELASIEQEIIDSFSDLESDDIVEIPVINDSEDWF